MGVVRAASDTGATDGSGGEVLRQRLHERLGEPQNLWVVKVRDDEAEESSGGQRRHLVASIAGLEFGCGGGDSVGYQQRDWDALET